MIDGLKPHSEYKDSGLPWVGVLPTHWKVERAKGRFKKLNRPIRPEDETVTCFRDGTVTLRKNRRLRGFTEAIYELGYQGIRKGDLVIHAMDAFAGAVGVSDSDGKGSPIYGVCRPIFDDSPYYYAHVVREMSRTQWILALSRGIRERSTDFRFESFARQFVPVPPPDEQAAIVKFLDYANGKIERAIRAKRKLIGLLNEQKQAITHRAVTRGLDPNVKLKPSGIPWLGDVPEHWEIKRIKYLMNTVDCRSATGDEVLLSMRKYHGLVPYHEHFHKPPQAATLKGFKLVKPGQIVVNRMQAGFGLISSSTYDGLVSPDFGVFQPTGEVVPEFLGELFRSREVRAQFQRESKGLGTGQSGFMRLYDDRIGIVHIAFPPFVDEQHMILSHLKDDVRGVENTIRITEREIALLLEYRTTLTAEVVTGKLDVREAAKRLPDEGEHVLPPDESLDDLVEDEIIEEDEA
jgi:type I restriction enzyme S subunit